MLRDDCLAANCELPEATLDTWKGAPAKEWHVPFWNVSNWKGRAHNGRAPSKVSMREQDELKIILRCREHLFPFRRWHPHYVFDVADKNLACAHLSVVENFARDAHNKPGIDGGYDYVHLNLGNEGHRSFNAAVLPRFAGLNAATHDGRHRHAGHAYLGERVP